MITGGIGWVVAVNLIIWTGLVLYLLRLDGRLRSLETLENGKKKR
jgi:CcmD family protein